MSDEIDYGPLAALIGTWQGNQGVDVSPEPDENERSEYHETIVFEAIGDVTNAEAQDLVVLRYHQVVVRTRDNKVFHNETGYLSWDAQRGIVTQNLTIPRGVALVAGGTASADATEFEVRASVDDPDWPISQSPFMRDNAKTTSFRHRIAVNGDQLHYDETTWVTIYGRDVEHTDANELRRA